MIPAKSLIPILLLLFALTSINCTLKQERIRLYDRNATHYVLGCNSVVSSYGKFQYEEIKQTLEIMFGVSDYRVFSISLLNTITSRDTKERYIEENFYNQYPGRPNEAVVDRIPSYYHNFPIVGSLISPQFIPSFLLSKFVKYHKYIRFDNLQKLFEVIRTQMSYRLNSMIVVHSIEGFDRVSFVMGAYQMKFLNYGLKDVMKEILGFYGKNKRTGGLGWRFYNGLQWYCLGLGRSAEECLIGAKGNEATSYDL